MRFISLLICFTSFSLCAQDKCFEGCWANFGNSKLPFPEKNRVTLNELLGCKIPDFKVESIAGDKFSIRELEGKIVVINFWFGSCPPCLVELPALNRLADEYRSSEVVFIAFGRDSKQEILEFTKKHPFKYNLVSANEAQIKSYCLLGGWPMNLVADKNGILRYIKAGGPAGKSNEMMPYTEMKPIIDQLRGDK